MANEWMDRFLTYNPNTMGLNAYNRMRGAGYSNQQIQAGVQGRGLHVGMKARGPLSSGAQPNWMNQYTGSQGNIGLTTYNRLKGVPGKTVLDIQRDQGASGMSMGRLAREQFNTDLQSYHQQQADEKTLQQQAALKEEQWKAEIQQQMADMTAQVNEPAVNPAETRIPGYSTSSTVGGGATETMKIRETGRGSSRKSTFKRKAWSMPTTNTAAGKGGGSPVNV